jgi:Tfp pilus tip-associated adhesin PilY1
MPGFTAEVSAPVAEIDGAGTLQYVYYTDAFGQTWVYVYMWNPLSGWILLTYFPL